MEVVTILILVLSLAVVVIGTIGMVRAFAGFDPAERDDVGGSVEEIHTLHELAERRAMLIQLIRAVQLDLESGKISDEEAKLRVSRFERRAVRVARAMDELVGDEALRERAAETLRAHLEAHDGELHDADWQWSDEALRRHGGSPKTLETDHA